MLSPIIRKLTPAGLVLMQQLEHCRRWKENYKVKQIIEGKVPINKWWVEEIKGITFDSEAEAWEFAYVVWCNANVNGVRSALMDVQ